MSVDVKQLTTEQLEYRVKSMIIEHQGRIGQRDAAILYAILTELSDRRKAAAW